MSKNINVLIDELLQLVHMKYDHLQVGLDTLQIDIVFIQKFEDLKSILGIERFDDIEMRDYPKIQQLQEMIGKINAFEDNRNKRQVRVSKAVNAYKKNKNGA